MTDNQPVMRVSYSLLNLWHQGRYEDAITVYTGGSLPSNQYMEAGKEWHKKWEKEVKATGKFPAVFGDRSFDNPIVEEYVKVQVLPWLQLGGILDVEDGVLGIDWKTGTGSAGRYAGGWQHKVYKVMRPHLEVFEYHAFNQYTGEITFERIHLTEHTFDEGLEWIISTASDMRATLEQMGIPLERPKRHE